MVKKHFLMENNTKDNGKMIKSKKEMYIFLYKKELFLFYKKQIILFFIFLYLEKEKVKKHMLIKHITKEIGKTIKSKYKA